MQKLFDSMDHDGSGKLNLGLGKPRDRTSLEAADVKAASKCHLRFAGELQSTAIRLSDLASRVQIFCEENEARFGYLDGGELP